MNSETSLHPTPTPPLRKFISIPSSALDELLGHLKIFSAFVGPWMCSRSTGWGDPSNRVKASALAKGNWVRSSRSASTKGYSPEPLHSWAWIRIREGQMRLVSDLKDPSSTAKSQCRTIGTSEILGAFLGQNY